MSETSAGPRRFAYVAAGSALIILAGFVAWRLTRGPGSEGENPVSQDLEVVSPTRPLLPMELREEFSEELSQDLHEFSARFVAGNNAGATAFLSPRFRGRALDGAEHENPVDLGLGTTLVRDRTASLRVVNRAGFIASVEARLKGWRRLDAVQWVVASAEFQQGRPVWGRAVLNFAFLGAGEAGEPRSLRGSGTALVKKRGAAWTIDAFEPSALEEQSRAAALFADVSAAAGVAVQGAPWGQRPNDGFAWHGAASADVNGDGLLDIFLPSRPRNFLYIARPEGGYVDEAEARGVATPGGGTGAVFFDFDNDGDLDLAVADDSHRMPDGVIVGSPLRFYRFDGQGNDWRYREVGHDLGFDALTNAYSLVVFDYDGDGYLDLFVVNYAPERKDFPGAWTNAENGTPDFLYRNVGGRRFEDAAERAGVADRRWGYAAAAADYDRDGDQDLYVANDFGLNRLWRNDGDGRFTDVAEAAGTLDRGFGMSVSWADLDNDGRLDLYVSNMSSVESTRILDRVSLKSPSVDALRKMGSGNSLLLFRDGRFDQSPASLGAVDCEWAWGSVPFDLDLDGRLDIFCTNGYITGRAPGDANSFYWRHVLGSSIEAAQEPSLGVREQVASRQYRNGQKRLVFQEHRSFAGHQRDRLWRNSGADGFADLSDVSGADSPLDGRAALAADFDDDGDADLFVHEMQGQLHHLYRNDAADPKNGFLKIRLRATRGQWEAIGAEVVVRGAKAPCSQVLSCGTGYLSCQPPELLFGLGGAAAGEVEVYWPAGKRESFGRIRAGSRVMLVEGSGRPAPFPARAHPLERPPQK